MDAEGLKRRLAALQARVQGALDTAQRGRLLSTGLQVGSGALRSLLAAAALFNQPVLLVLFLCCPCTSLRGAFLDVSDTLLILAADVIP